MGATRAHKLHTSLRGGYEYNGPTIVDCQNYKRDCDNFVGRGDAKTFHGFCFLHVDNHNCNVVVGSTLFSCDLLNNTMFKKQFFKLV
ncbi:hypothetical protein Ccrd_010682 [Cynara cardunculus var. scolymus]|uniref:Uncharacterized protein n=1 Tax=Cynara cardunculus var. scolymus TaxID=59895 RepID=A0A103YKP9_CYNCS|nr:hypothetical protein Ccrd_010682 [Cynara cardunculus var. scolymus]